MMIFNALFIPSNNRFLLSSFEDCQSLMNLFTMFTNTSIFTGLAR